MFYDSLRDIVLERVGGNKARLQCVEELGLMVSASAVKSLSIWG